MARREISPQCPHCDSGYLTKTNHTTQTDVGMLVVVRRHRKCDTCERSATTIEMSELMFRSADERQRLALTLIDLVEKHVLARMRD